LLLTRRAPQAGFTLVELMVALTGGLFVTMAVFVLSKQATSLYQSEARLSNATLGSIVGFERLRTDIERAGFLTSPNVARDPKVCGVPDAQWPAGAAGQNLRHLSSIWIEPEASVPTQLAANGITPDKITLAGSYASPDQFPTGPIYDDGTNNIVTLQAGSGPMVRLGYAAAVSAVAQRAVLLSVFGIGRMLRIVDTAGREQYGSIVNVQEGATPSIFVSKTAPPILYRGASTTLKCGVQGVGDKSLVNVVNFIQYSVRDMTGSARYAALFGSGNAPPSDAGRTELVREELDARGDPIVDGTGVPMPEIISEFAVDLGFNVTVSQVVTSGTGAQLETLAQLPSSDRSNWVGPAWGSNPGTAAAASRGPQLVRAVRARLSVRSREADRLANVVTFGDGGTAPVMGGLYRFRVPVAGGPTFARVRTVQADIAIRSHRGATWL
jgi:Tfp pilus assembly protein PilW